MRTGFSARAVEIEIGLFPFERRILAGHPGFPEFLPALFGSYSAASLTAQSSEEKC
jgi:hypothetical protein